MASHNDDVPPIPESQPGRATGEGSPAAVPADEPATTPTTDYSAYSTTSTTGPTPVLSIISLIAGIVGILGIWVVFVPVLGSILGLPIPLAAVILGFLGKKREPQAAKGLWLTGIILGFIGLAAALLALVVWLILFATVGATGYTYTP